MIFRCIFTFGLIPRNFVLYKTITCSWDYKEVNRCMIMIRRYNIKADS